MSVTRRVIREAIQQVLLEHVEEPFMLIREIGLQARLWCLLCQELNPEFVIAQIRNKRKSSLHQHTRNFKTSRVQLELKVGGTEKSDIVVLRADRRPQLTCYPAGPTDVVAAIKPDDVEAVIEMKASPSSNIKNVAAFAGDIEKLHNFRVKHRNIQCCFVLIDKSLPVPGTACDPRYLPGELWPLKPPRTLLSPSGENDGGFVEVWDIACNPVPTPRRRDCV